MIKINNRVYTIKKSTNKLKKYDVFDDNNKKLFSFGSALYQHYKDRIGDFSNLDHNDKKRRTLYYTRHNKSYPLLSPDSFSKIFLW